MQRTQSVAVQKWQSIESHFNSWFHHPDLAALRIVLSCVRSHYQLATDPVWPIVVGPSGTGKTEICINPLLTLPNTYLQGSISPKAFLSGHNSKEGSLLRRIGQHGIMVFKDFGTVISAREQDRMEVAACLREIYDGAFSRQVGGKNLPVWKGKVTAIAAATPAIDRAWGIMQELGDRFVFVRWPRGNGLEIARAARHQLGHEREIRETSQRLIQDFLADAPMVAPNPLGEAYCERIQYLAEMTAWLRRKIIRDNPDGHRTIIDVPEAEGPGRLMKAMALVATHHALLFSRDTVDEDDFTLARRLAYDSVPAARMRFIQSMLVDADTKFSDIAEVSRIPRGSINWIADELEALGAIDHWQESEHSYRFTEEFADIMKGTGTLPDDLSATS